MGSSAKDYYESLDQEYRDEEAKKKSLEQTKRKVEINAFVKNNEISNDFWWMWENREKIIRNKKLINLIG